MTASKDVVTLPTIGTLTTTEIHASVIGFIIAFYVGATRASSQLRREPWYFLGMGFLGLLLGVEVDRRTRRVSK